MKATKTKVLVAAAALMTSPLLAGCGANFGAQTDQIYIPADGVNDHDGMIAVLNALIFSETPGTGRLIAGLVNADNDTDDRILEVVGVDENEEVEFVIGEGDRTIPAGGLLDLSDDGVAPIFVYGLPGELRAGGFIRLEIRYEVAEPDVLNVPVLNPLRDYDVELPAETDSIVPEE